MGSPSAGRQQDPRNATSSRTSATGNRRGPACAYKIKALRDRVVVIAAQAERNCEQFVSQWKARRPRAGAAPEFRKTT